MWGSNKLRNRFFIHLIFTITLVSGISSCKEGTKNAEGDAEKSVSPAENITTFYLIRHAEKDRTDSSNSNPELNQDGLGRAMQWAEVLENAGLTAIYSTNFERTSMTAAPAAVKYGIEVQYYDPSAVAVETLIEENKGGNVLIVGHSNTTPTMVNALLGEEKYPNMDDTDNASLFVVRIIDGVATDFHLQMD